VLDVAPSRDEIDQRVAQVAAGRFRRPVLVRARSHFPGGPTVREGTCN
jgi:hypothetical protein